MDFEPLPTRIFFMCLFGKESFEGHEHDYLIDYNIIEWHDFKLIRRYNPTFSILIVNEFWVRVSTNSVRHSWKKVFVTIRFTAGSCVHWRFAYKIVELFQINYVMLTGAGIEIHGHICGKPKNRFVENIREHLVMVIQSKNRSVDTMPVDEDVL